MKAIIWAAVSSEAQTERVAGKQSIPEQIAQARAYIEQRGWHEVADPLVVDGHTRSFSGVSPLTDAAAELPQYATLLQLTREAKIDVVVCRGRDRLGRTSSLVSTLEQYLLSRQVQILSLDMPTRILTRQELAEGHGRGTIWSAAIESARSQDEVSTLKIRQRSGMRRRCKQGYHSGAVPYGYRLNSETNVAEIHDDEAQVVRLIFSWFTQGESYHQIARKLPLYAACKLPSRRYLSQIVRNVFYAGKTRWGYKGPSQPVVADGLHEPIIDIKMWEAAQIELERRKDLGPRRSFSTNVLTGFVWCPCGSHMRVVWGSKWRGKQYRYYRCVQGCSGGRNLDKLEAEVKRELTRWMTNPEALRRQLKETSVPEHLNERKALERTLQQHRQAIELWSQDYQLRLISRHEYYSRRASLEETIQEIQNELAKHEAQRNPDDVARDMEELAVRAKHGLEQMWQDPAGVKYLKATFRRIGLHITVLPRRPPFITVL